MTINVVKFDSKYPYKSKKRRIIKKWQKQHTVSIESFNNAVVVSVGNTMYPINFTWNVNMSADFGKCEHPN